MASIRVGTSVSRRVIFLCSPGDEEEIIVCQRTGAEVQIVEWEAGHGDWARKINYGFTLSEDPFVLLGADDLAFHSGWDTAALEVAERTGAGVIGTNDLGNATVMAGKHSTHPLVRRSYIDEYGTVDERGKILHEGYRHQWVDTELVETAKARGQWAFAKDSRVEHLHPFWHKGKMDATYKKALSTPQEDHHLFANRRNLWIRERRRARLSA
jgi:hypothetical protein